MDILRKGMITPTVARWQHFLKEVARDKDGKCYYSGDVDSVFSKALEVATKNYQKDRSVPQTGAVDLDTVVKARDEKYVPERIFRMRPNPDADIREARPYFLIPLPEPPEKYRDKFAEREQVLKDIFAWVQGIERASPAPSGEPVITDLYIFSHGWHRNFYSAVSAYDRISSRLARLMRAGRFDPSGGSGGFKPSEGEGFRPLFLNLHWHSDPGADGFVDTSGRRDKDSFMRQALAAFEPKSNAPGAPPPATAEEMVSDLEDIFAYFSHMAAPDVDPLADREDRALPKDLLDRLDRYQLKNLSENSLSLAQQIAIKGEKAAVAWTCYHEAQVQAVLLDQTEKPAGFSDTKGALDTLFKFLWNLFFSIALLVPAFKILFRYLQWPSQWSALLKPAWVDSCLAWLAKQGLPIAFDSIRVLGHWMLGSALVVFFFLIVRASYVEGQEIDIYSMANQAFKDESQKAEAAERAKRRHLQQMAFQPSRMWISFVLCLVGGIAALRTVFTAPNWIAHLVYLESQHRLLGQILPLLDKLFWHSVYAGGSLCLLACIAWAILLRKKAQRSRNPQRSGRNPVSISLVAWVFFQPAIVIPVGVYLLITFLFGGGKSRGSEQSRFSDLSPEKLQSPEQLQLKMPSNFREHIAIAARIPVKLLQFSVAPDNRAYQWLDTIDGMLAFYEMQRKGVDTGAAAFAFLERLLAKDLPDGSVNPLRSSEMRIHLVGHSFGTLVVSNLARAMAAKYAASEHTYPQLHTLCLLEGALAGNWFEEEAQLHGFTKGAIASIFSLYDTANGVYYPLANSARLATGYVGLTKVANTIPAERGKFVLLVAPPDLTSPQFDGPRKTDPTPGYHPPDRDHPAVLNLDGSRAIFQGPAASGGGHTDIFKDTVINLIWAVTRMKT